jgi:hypothetical protein
MPKFLMTAEVEWDVLPDETQIEQGVEPDELSTVDDIDAYDIADCICESIPHDDEMFAGSNLFVTVAKVSLEEVLDGPDTGLAPGEEHATYPVDDWKYEVANGDTRLGYSDWVEAQLEQEVD